MADVSSTLRAWSATAASNLPIGTTTVGTGLDDNLREIQAVLRQYLASPGANIASATTTNLATATGLHVHITGTTTITGLGTESAGIYYLLEFDDALTLTHNATTLDLPGDANITTVAGDMALMLSKGAGNWKCVYYTRASGYSIAAAPSVTVANEASDTTCFPLFVTAATGDLAAKTNASLLFNSSTGALGLASGAVGTPTIYLNGETTTGLYRIGANNHGYAISGAKVLDIAAAGLGVTGYVTATGFQSTSNATAAAGSGVEVLGGASGIVQAYNRTGSAYLNLALDGLAVSIKQSGTNVGVFSSTGLAVTGTLSATGAISLLGTPASAGAGVRYISGGGTSGSFYTNVPTGSNQQWAVNESVVMALISTGLQVTGTLSATSTFNADGGAWFGTAALATGATTGHLYIPTSAGAPTGVPAAKTGQVALQFDTTNNKLYVYDGGWLSTAALT